MEKKQLKKSIVIRMIMLMLILSFNTIRVEAQLIKDFEIEALKYLTFGDQKWKKIAENIYPNIKLDDNNAINYMKIIELPNKSKDEIFENIKIWVTSIFTGSECDIRMVDKEAGCIIAQAAERKLVENTSGWDNEYIVSLKPVLKIDVKDEKARVTFTVSSYYIHRERITGGIFSSNIHNEEVWGVVNCYPFNKYDHEHPKTSAMALVATHLCAIRYMEIVEAALKKQNISNDNW